MKNWLMQKEEEHKNLFQELLELSQKTLKVFNQEEKKEIFVRVIFSKDKWIEGSAKIELLVGDINEECNVIETYEHSIYNKNRDIQQYKDLFKLMSKGLFTNAWFSVLDSARSYDTQFIVTDKEIILENDNCEYLENRMKDTHSGLNLTLGEKKNKIK